ncbi:uncharacterized protein EAF01_008521 [Botrytis porri]|uniref:BTB domain-containing protein n=1 Tax=Botrytis porri TaxID=87229 RepID=A0A4Z1KAB0_9HELO|nr:uncharacterized protein EAF01_008521 [Botrytis porri]KAF7899308.1 hypothetical protein EAF01_008521 [Botrytis porri]TGO82937.1 hypothetical protein BPOR_0730g00040 [Botrytis porri]
MDLNRPLGDKININTNDSQYYVHAELLRRNPKFFDIYEHRSVMTIDVGSEVFESFVQWLYNRDLFKHPTGGVQLILGLWFFAAKISCLELQNYAMDWIQDYHQDERMEDSDLRYVFETIKNDYEYTALGDFCGAMLRKRNSEYQFTAVHRFLQAVPGALGPYIFYESLCDDIDELRSDPTRRDKIHLCRFHIHNYNDKICGSKPNVQ